jgi:hypothetical protein
MAFRPQAPMDLRGDERIQPAAFVRRYGANLIFGLRPKSPRLSEVGDERRVDCGRICHSLRGSASPVYGYGVQ